MSELVDSYTEVAGKTEIERLRQLSETLEGCSVVHVNSTRVGGGVAEILMKFVPLMQDLGLETSWEVVTGESEFYKCTKSMHNGLQGNPVDISESLLSAYEKTSAENAEKLRDKLEQADIVIIHDPQPAALLKLCPNRKGKWIWRCHIDASNPYPPVWNYLREYIAEYDASIFSLPDFAQPLPHNQYIVPPSIDPLSEKNMDLDKDEIVSKYSEYGIDPDRPVITQVSRFDRFKDPVGVIEAYSITKKLVPALQLILAGGGADDDPEGEEVLKEVYAAADDDPDIHVLLLPPDAHRTINALQRLSDIVIQKSTREGFGLTVSEAMWKGKAVIGGNTGGIKLQVINHHTGFLVDTPEGASLRTRHLLSHPEELLEMGVKARGYVRENFLITRQLREYLSLMRGVLAGTEGTIVAG